MQYCFCEENNYENTYTDKIIIYYKLSIIIISYVLLF